MTTYETYEILVVVLLALFSLYLIVRKCKDDIIPMAGKYEIVDEREVEYQNKMRMFDNIVNICDVLESLQDKVEILERNQARLINKLKKLEKISLEKKTKIDKQAFVFIRRSARIAAQKKKMEEPVLRRSIRISLLKPVKYTK